MFRRNRNSAAELCHQCLFVLLLALTNQWLSSGSNSPCICIRSEDSFLSDTSGCTKCHLSPSNPDLNSRTSISSMSTVIQPAGESDAFLLWVCPAPCSSWNVNLRCEKCGHKRNVIKSPKASQPRRSILSLFPLQERRSSDADAQSNPLSGSPSRSASPSSLTRGAPFSTRSSSSNSLFTTGSVRPASFSFTPPSISVLTSQPPLPPRPPKRPFTRSASFSTESAISGPNYSTSSTPPLLTRSYSSSSLPPRAHSVASPSRSRRSLTRKSLPL